MCKGLNSWIEKWPTYKRGPHHIISGLTRNPAPPWRPCWWSLAYSEHSEHGRQETLEESFIAVVDARSSLYASPPRHSGINTMAVQAIPS